jgi:SHS2 domain-containing protein
MAAMAAPRFRQLAHTADVRLAIWGANERELLENAVAGALRYTLGRPAAGKPRRWRRLPRWPQALPDRLVRIVNEALFLLYVRRELVVAVRCSRHGASLGVAPLPPHRMPVTEVKAATFHALRPVSSPRLAAVLTLDV